MNILVDAYVIFWKHFERQKSNDEDFLARASCALCGGFALLNIAQIIAYGVGRDLSMLYSSSRLAQFIVVGAGIGVGAGLMNRFLARHPEIQGRDQITRRYNEISRLRAVGIVVLAFLNFAMLLLIREVHNWIQR